VIMLLILSFGLIAGLIGWLWVEDVEIMRYERYISGQPDPDNVPQYEAKRHIKMNELQGLLLRTGAFGVLGIVWLFFMIRATSAFALFALVLLVMLIYHVYVLQRYFEFWRPLQLRELTRDYRLEEGVAYTLDADGELSVDEQASPPEPIRYELRGSGELVPIYAEEGDDDRRTATGSSKGAGKVRQ